MATERIHFPDISSHAWEHPADTAALTALRRVPGFDLVLRKVFGLFSERSLRLMTTANAVEIGPTQYPEINAAYEEALAVLDAPTRYPLFLSDTPIVQAGAMGMENPFIVLDARSTYIMSVDELRVMMAHEISHILSDHVLYKTLLRLLLKVSPYVFSFPLTAVALFGVIAALLEWDRKSELSADRAALLAVQNRDQVHSTLMMLAGGQPEGADLETFRAQAVAYAESGDTLDTIIKMIALLGSNHPFPAFRLAELQKWEATGAYEEILSGTYPVRQDDVKTSAWDLWKESIKSYSDTVRGTADPVVTWLQDTATSAADRASDAFHWLRNKIDEQIR